MRRREFIVLLTSALTAWPLLAWPLLAWPLLAWPLAARAQKGYTSMTTCHVAPNSSSFST